MLEVDVAKKLDNFSLNLKLVVENGLTVLLGPSGSGKSTLLNIIAGLLAPDSGRILFDDEIYFNSGREKKNLPAHLRKLGYVFQQPMLFPHLTVRQNILYGLSARNPARKELGNLLELLRLRELEDRMPKQISGGQAQRVALARALITQPRLLLLDEPFSALDNFIRRKVRRDLIRVLEEYRIPGLLVTHDLNEALLLGDKVALMDAGRILQHGDPREIFSRPSSRKVARFVGMLNIYSGVVQKVMGEDSLLIAGEKFPVEMDYLPLEPGEKVSFGIRPEDVLYLRPERDLLTGENTLTAKIAAVFSQGAMDRVLLQVTSDAYDLEMLLPHHVVAKRGLGEGGLCRVSLPKKSLHYLD